LYNFDLLSNGFLTTFVRPVITISDIDKSGSKKIEVPIAIGGKKDKKTGGKKSSATGGKKDGEISGKKTTIHSKGILIEGEYLKLPERQKDVLLLIVNDNKITIARVAKFFGINNSAAQKHFDALKTKNIITRKKGDKGGYWNIIINIEKIMIEGS